jgi:hypothetical protein
VPVVDHVEEHVRGIGGVRVTDLVDDEDRGIGLARQRVRQTPVAKAAERRR